MSRVRAHLSFSNVVAVVALFVALGGAALAAGNAFVGSGGVIQGCIGKHGALAVVKAHKKCPKHTTSLAFNQKGQAGRNGTRGTNGTNGSGGPPYGAAGGSLSGTYPKPSLATSALPLYSASAPAGQDFTSSTSGVTNFVALKVPSGTYLVLARTVMSATSGGALRAQSECFLAPRVGAGGDTVDWIAAMAPLSRGYQADATLSLQAPFTGPAEITLGCKNLSSPDVAISAYLSRIDAIRTTSNH